MHKRLQALEEAIEHLDEFIGVDIFLYYLREITQSVRLIFKSRKNIAVIDVVMMQ